MILLTLAMMLAIFSGCNQNASDKETAASKESSVSTETETESGATSSTKKETYTIGVTLISYDYTFFQDMLAAMKMRADEIGGIELVDYDAQLDVTKQINDVGDMISALKVDALLLNPVDSDSIGSAVLEANTAAIPVITVDTSSIEGDVYTHVASDNVEVGRMNGEYCVQLLKEKYGEAKGTVIVSSDKLASSMRDREQGILEAFETYPNIEVVVKYPPSAANVDGYNKLSSDVLTAYPKGKIDIWANLNSQSELGFLAAQAEAGRMEIMCVSVDEDPNILADIENADGTTQATVVQYPTDMGIQAVNYAIKALTGEDAPEGGIHSTTIKLITKDNIADYLAEKDEIEAMIEPYK